MIFSALRAHTRIMMTVIAVMAAAIAARAEEVSTEHQGLDVLGNLEIAPGKSLKTDGVLILVHDTLAHHRVDVIAAQQELLRERGVNTLAITLSLGLDKRRGMYNCAIEQDHRHDDAVDEIDTWVAWAKDKGAASIFLGGHGRGASQAALYAERKSNDKALKKLVLLAPMVQTFDTVETEYQQRYNRPLRDVVSQASEFVSKGNPGELLEGAGFLDCPSPKVTASSFTDYYSASPRFFTPNLLKSLKIPVIAVIGDQDTAEVPLSLALESDPALKAVRYERIPGADHFFTDVFAEQAADKIAAFIQQK